MIVTLDGGRGTIELRPDEVQISEFHERRTRLDSRRAALAEQARLPARTTDGVPFSVQVNIESLRDFDIFDASHTDGIGLCRTEFLYMERPQFPSEDEQFRMYRRVLEKMAPRPVTLRTLDIGGDKRLPYFQTPEESNPALGWRGLRVSLEWQDLLRVQLRAALRAGVGRDLRLMLPMVASLEEVHATRRIFSGVRSSLLEQGWDVERDVPVGIMIEVPSVLYCLDEFLALVDFVSVGTNDLVQYLLAVDRDNPWVSKLYEPFHPSVVRALASVAAAANRAGKPCSVCGDMADDPATALLLLGMGYNAVSVAPYFLPEIKLAVRRTSIERARELSREVLSQSSVDGVKQVLSDVRHELHA
jgi:phosphoenolpyruvate-protein phosphotransferase